MKNMIDFLRTLFNHRAIIEKLEEDKRWIEDNAFRVINSVGENQDLSLTIYSATERFGWIVHIRQIATTIQGALFSEVKVPNVEYIKRIILDIRKYNIRKNKKAKK